MQDVFSRAADALDIKAAAQRLSRSDLLLARPEDRLLGQAGRRLWDSIERGLIRGRYEPTPLVIVPIPKHDFTSRPAALLTLTDRVVYSAFTAALAPRVELALASPEVNLWPRASAARKRWAEFLRLPMDSDPSHVVRADVAGFYESIAHNRLAGVLTEATGRSEVVEALEEFLGRVMRSDRGIPQGLIESDTYATLFLSAVDRSMLLAGFDYWRHGDDVRIAVSSFSRGREALALLETELRALGLNLNGEKSSVSTVAGYLRDLESHDREKSALQKRYEDAQLAALRTGGREEVLRVLDQLQIPREVYETMSGDRETLITFAADWNAGLGPYQQLDVEAAIEILREHLSPDDIETAKAQFHEAMGHRPGSGKDAWPKEVFHTTLREALTTLAAGKDPSAIERCAEILKAHPSESDAISSYLLSVASDESQGVASAVSDVLTSGLFMFGWQAAWLYRVGESVAANLPPKMLEAAALDSSDPSSPWIRRAAAIRLLGRSRQLSRMDLARHWRQCPSVFRPDLVVAADFVAQENEPWAEIFLDACKGSDRILDVLVTHLALLRPNSVADGPEVPF